MKMSEMFRFFMFLPNPETTFHHRQDAIGPSMPWLVPKVFYGSNVFSATTSKSLWCVSTKEAQSL